VSNARGIDVSAFNGSIEHIIRPLDFCIVRASVGAFLDSRYEKHSHDVLMAHKVLGAYHFATYGPGPTRQARTLLNAAGNAAFLVVDDEGMTLAHPTTVRWIIANLHKLDRQRRHVLLYASDGNWPGDLGQDGNWVANWSHEPTRTWRFWQNTGVTLDHDEYHGTAAQLQAWAKTRRNPSA
jgi:GH25 family lysozyme M1 (1,4-beta-N-acetylmuramidase)